MTRRFIFSIALAAMLVSGATAFAQAQSGTSGVETTVSPSISFPIAELGGCESKEACKIYCDTATHHDACYTYAVAHSLMTKAQVGAARAVLAKKGPGGCTSQSECKTYCADTTHTSECLAFATQHQTIATTTALLIKKIKTEGGPGGCTSPDTCRIYCSDTAHLSECTEYGQNAGIVKKAPSSKIAEILKDTAGPGGCSSQEDCKTYCSDTTHGSECRQFALDHQLITQDQYDATEKFSQKTGPGGCTGADCKIYCSDTEHSKECYDYAVKNGLISKDKAEKAQTVQEAIKAGGPGGCTSPDACRAYCSNTDNKSECTAFIQQHTPRQPQTPGGASSSTPPGTGRPKEIKPGDTVPPNMPSTEGGASGGKPPVPSREEYCRAHADVCSINAAGEIQIKPKPTTPTLQTQPTTVLPPKPAIAPANTDLPPKPIIPPTTGTQPPASIDTPPNTSGAVTPTSAVFCNSLEECKAICAKSAADCAKLPIEIQQYIIKNSGGTTATPPTGTLLQPINTNNLGASVFQAFAQLLGF